MHFPSVFIEKPQVLQSACETNRVVGNVTDSQKSDVCWPPVLLFLRPVGSSALCGVDSPV